jgi:hypothetical protein
MVIHNVLARAQLQTEVETTESIKKQMTWYYNIYVNQFFVYNKCSYKSFDDVTKEWLGIRKRQAKSIHLHVAKWNF